MRNAGQTHWMAVDESVSEGTLVGELRKLTKRNLERPLSVIIDETSKDTSCDQLTDDKALTQY